MLGPLNKGAEVNINIKISHPSLTTNPTSSIKRTKDSTNLITSTQEEESLMLERSTDGNFASTWHAPSDGTFTLEVMLNLNQNNYFVVYELFLQVNGEEFLKIVKTYPSNIFRYIHLNKTTKFSITSKSNSLLRLYQVQPSNNFYMEEIERKSASFVQEKIIHNYG